jgi:transcriptional regulator with XRE-family HTH domain
MNDSIFSEWFKEALKKSRLSGAELAERARISKQAVYCYLDSSRLPSPDVVAKLCAAMRVPVENVPQFERRAVGNPRTKRR